MEGIRGLACLRAATRCMFSAAILAALSLSAFRDAAAQGSLAVTPGLPGKNVNIIGPSPKPGYIPDFAMRQQNEPTCSVRPETPAFIICAFNDYRATDLPSLAGDSWIGMAWSGDFGLTWFSRLAPGYRGDDPALALGLDFAADANVVHAPGNSPGIAFLNYIAANRDLDDGVLALQRLAVMPQEDVEYYVPEKKIFIIDETNSGRFSDRPTMIAVADPPNRQTTQSYEMTLEDGRVVTRNVPSGTLIFGYAIFTGSNGSKIYITRCTNWGETCENPIKISEEQQRVQGVSLTNIGDKIVAAWRRADGKGDAVIYAYSSNGGKRWTKGATATELCSIDQGASGTSMRLLNVPWTANDGNRFYIFSSDRRFGGDQSCENGIPKIGVTWSSDGKNWSGFQALEDDSVPNPGGEPSANGFQIFPTAAGFRGNVQVAWYDTRRETFGAGLPAEAGTGQVPILLRDYLTSGGDILHRKMDVYTLKIRGVDGNGNPLAMPEISPAIRATQFKTGRSLEGTSSVFQEVETFFPNIPMFEQGTRAFNGDWITAAVPDFRRSDDDATWIQNSLSTGFEATDQENVLLAWGDPRDARGRYFGEAGGPAPFTPNNDAQAVAMELQRQAENDEPIMIAKAIEAAADDAEMSLRSESVVDVPATFGQCVPSDPQDRTRNSNIYATMVASVPEFVALTPTKQLTGFQRTIPILLTNPSLTDERTFTLRIEGQPPDQGPPDFTGRLSWRQIPSFGPFDNQEYPLINEIQKTVGRNSSESVTAFLVTNATEDIALPIRLYDSDCDTAGCPVLSTIIVGGSADTDFFDSEYCTTGPGAGTTICASVLSNEYHDPELIATPDFQTPDFQITGIITPDFQTPDFQTPDFQTQDLEALGFLSPDMQTPDFQTPDFQTPDFQTPDFQTPDMQTPDFQTPDFQTAAYTDITYTLKNTGNVTTTFSADMTFTGVDPEELTAAQLAAWTTYVTATSRECAVDPVWQTQVISSENLSTEQLQSIVLPSVDDPFAGPITFPLRPGQTINITLRLIAERDPETGASVLDNLTPAEFQAGTGFAASAHSCSDPTAIDFDVDCLTLNEEVIRIDNTPPVITVPSEPVIAVEADRPGGACVDVTASGLGLVTAEDDGVPVDVICIADSTGGPVCTTDPSSAELPLPLNNPSLDPTTQLTCSATDAAGNTASVDLEVQVEDNTPPELPSPFDMPPVFVDADAPVGENTAMVDFGPFVAPDVVAGDITMTCSPDTTFAFPIGSTDVTCEAVDNGFNSCAFQDPSACTEPPGDGRNRVAGTLTVRVADTTPPTGTVPTATTFEANTAGGANANYALPVFDDNFDPEPVEATCTPPPGSFFALEDSTGDGVLDATTASISCSATDAGMNTGTLDFDITIQDTQPPTIEAANGVSFPVDVAVDSSGFGTLNFEAQVVATDVDGVDPDPSISCSAGSASSGDPLAIGSYTVTCAATDASGNSSAAFNYEVSVGFGDFVGVNFGKGNVKAGSSVPTTFGWAGEGSGLINSSDADPLISALNCETGAVVLNPGVFPGNSDLRWDGSALLWKFNWQTVLQNGDPIPAAKGGTDYCLVVTSQKTGQVFPSNEGPITVRP